MYCRVWGVGHRESEFKIKHMRFRDWGPGSRVYRLGFKVQGIRFQDLDFKVWVYCRFTTACVAQLKLCLRFLGAHTDLMNTVPSRLYLP